MKTKCIYVLSCIICGLASDNFQRQLSPGAQAADFAPEPPASAPATNALTLEKAIQMALEFNLESRVYQGRVQAAAGRAAQAKPWSNPELNLSAEDWPTDGGGFSDAKKLVGVSQAVPFPGKKKWERAIGTADLKTSQAELAAQQAELGREVKKAFCRVLAGEELVKTTRELNQVAESLATNTHKRVAAGAAPDQELLRAEISLEQVKVELAASQRELASARQQLGGLLGQTNGASLMLSGVLAETPNPDLANLGPTAWLSDHPSMMAAKKNQERAQAEWRRSRLDPYPDVKVSVAGGRDSGGEGSIIQFGLSLPLPIIDRAKGKQQEAKAKAAIATTELAAQHQRLLQEWEDARQRLTTAAGQAAAYRERILPKVNDALRLVQTGFEQGKFGFMDILDTQRTAAEARLAYQQKLLELNLAQADLEALAGKTYPIVSK